MWHDLQPAGQVTLKRWLEEKGGGPCVVSCSGKGLCSAVDTCVLLMIDDDLFLTALAIRMAKHYLIFELWEVILLGIWGSMSRAVLLHRLHGWWTQGYGVRHHRQKPSSSGKGRWGQVAPISSSLARQLTNVVLVDNRQLEGQQEEYAVFWKSDI
ncbi:jg9169 [Pararge aegeria aegeria]|uniref:Jg9169 protein n=1 Tax=Pararge aegeria aegeria TaxID=348720 RepID=A0A8S4QW74_9NEOP|nr:jg9169 [Pararge aegeria aegeria]